MRDLVNNFENVTLGESGEEKGVFYFTHSGTMLKFLSFLGLFMDAEPLRHNNYDQMLKERAWKTSLFDSFASNVAFVLQKCGQTQFRVGMFLNERLTKIPGCEEEWCDYKLFRDIYYRKNPEDCDFSSICDLESKEDQFSVLESVPDDRF